MSDEEREKEAQQRMAEAAASEAEQNEADQEMEQFLRRVPDDPGAFLRRKFERKAQLDRRNRSQNDDQQRW